MKYALVKVKPNELLFYSHLELPYEKDLYEFSNFTKYVILFDTEKEAVNYANELHIEYDWVVGVK